MEIDDPACNSQSAGAAVGGGPRDLAAAAAAEAVAASLNAATYQRTLRGSISTPSTSSDKEKPNFDPGTMFKQCSNAKTAGRNVNVYSTETDGSFNIVESATLPRVGNMYRDGEDELAKTFHGARIMKGGGQW
jgi:hypothetical protein